MCTWSKTHFLLQAFWGSQPTTAADLHLGLDHTPEDIIMHTIPNPNPNPNTNPNPSARCFQCGGLKVWIIILWKCLISRCRYSTWETWNTCHVVSKGNPHIHQLSPELQCSRCEDATHDVRVASQVLSSVGREEKWEEEPILDLARKRRTRKSKRVCISTMKHVRRDVNVSTTRLCSGVTRYICLMSFSQFAIRSGEC